MLDPEGLDYSFSNMGAVGGFVFADQGATAAVVTLHILMDSEFVCDHGLETAGRVHLVCYLPKRGEQSTGRLGQHHAQPIPFFSYLIKLTSQDGHYRVRLAVIAEQII